MYTYNKGVSAHQNKELQGTIKIEDKYYNPESDHSNIINMSSELKLSQEVFEQSKSKPQDISLVEEYKYTPVKPQPENMSIDSNTKAVNGPAQISRNPSIYSFEGCKPSSRDTPASANLSASNLVTLSNNESALNYSISEDDLPPLPTHKAPTGERYTYAQHTGNATLEQILEKHRAGIQSMCGGNSPIEFTDTESEDAMDISNGRYVHSADIVTTSAHPCYSSYQ